MALVLAIIGAACIVYGIAIMSLWSGTWFFAVWYALGAILIGVGWALHSGAWEQAPVAIKRTLEIAGCALLACVIVFGGMALSGFGQQGEDDLDYIVVLGAQVYEDHPSVVLQYRLDTACDYLRKNEDTVCIVSRCHGGVPGIAWRAGIAHHQGRRFAQHDREYREQYGNHRREKRF